MFHGKGWSGSWLYHPIRLLVVILAGLLATTQVRAEWHSTGTDQIPRATYLNSFKSAAPPDRPSMVIISCHTDNASLPSYLTAEILLFSEEFIFNSSYSYPVRYQIDNGPSQSAMWEATVDGSGLYIMDFDKVAEDLMKELDGISEQIAKEYDYGTPLEQILEQEQISIISEFFSILSIQVLEFLRMIAQGQILKLTVKTGIFSKIESELPLAGSREPLRRVLTACGQTF